MHYSDVSQRVIKCIIPIIYILLFVIFPVSFFASSFLCLYFMLCGFLPLIFYCYFIVSEIG